MSTPTLPELLRSAREAKRWTRTQTAAALRGLTGAKRCGATNIGHYETGARRIPTEARVRALADLLGLDPDTAVRLWQSPSVPTQPRPHVAAGTPPAAVGADLTPSEGE